MFTKKEIMYLAQKHEIHPNILRGQNFLIDQGILDSIIKIADLKNDDEVLEVGPGFGTLTFALLPKVKTVWAVEADRKLATLLEKSVYIHAHKDHELKIIHQDIRKYDIEECVAGKKYKVVANLPYNITSWFIRNILDRVHQPTSVTLMLQKEVAERIVEKPGNMSMLSLSVQYFCTPTIMRTVPASSFWPKPKIDSAVIQFSNIHTPDFQYQKAMFRYMKMGFAGKRKQLQNTLSAGTHIAKEKIQETIEKQNLNPQIRPQELSIDNWKGLTIALEELQKDVLK